MLLRNKEPMTSHKFVDQAEQGSEREYKSRTYARMYTYACPHVLTRACAHVHVGAHVQYVCAHVLARARAHV